jgi:hypothetical protein
VDFSLRYYLDAAEPPPAVRTCTPLLVTAGMLLEITIFIQFTITLFCLGLGDSEARKQPLRCQIMFERVLSRLSDIQTA